jgi:hypothetical protein
MRSNQLAYVRAIRRYRGAEQFRQWGDLYGAAYDERERAFIYDECWRVGMLMGVDRLDFAPRCLGKDDLKTFFPKTRRRTA